MSFSKTLFLCFMAAHPVFAEQDQGRELFTDDLTWVGYPDPEISDWLPDLVAVRYGDQINLVIGCEAEKFLMALLVFPEASSDLTPHFVTVTPSDGPKRNFRARRAAMQPNGLLMWIDADSLFSSRSTTERFIRPLMAEGKVVITLPHPNEPRDYTLDLSGFPQWIETIENRCTPALNDG